MAVTVNLGRVQPLYRGPYLASFPYRPLDFVTFEGVTYYCIKPVTGTAPPDPEFWVSILQLPLGLAAGGTGATDAEGARTALGASELGDAVFTAEDAEAARGALGASSVGDSVFVAEDQAAARAVLGATDVGNAVFTAADPAAGRAALGASAFGGALFTADGEEAARAALELIELSDAQAADPDDVTFGTTNGQQLAAAAGEKILTDFNVAGDAPLYACRAWVKFNGSDGTILASGNVSSITRRGTGRFTINLITAMPDINYLVTGMAWQLNRTSANQSNVYESGSEEQHTPSSFFIDVTGGNSASYNDGEAVYIAVFR